MNADQNALLDQLEDLAFAFDLKAMTTQQLNDLVRICTELAKHAQTELGLRS